LRDLGREISVGRGTSGKGGGELQEDHKIQKPGFYGVDWQLGRGGSLWGGNFSEKKKYAWSATLVLRGYGRKKTKGLTS